jgi:hypothetical protein
LPSPHRLHLSYRLYPAHRTSNPLHHNQVGVLVDLEDIRQLLSTSLLSAFDVPSALLTVTCFVSVLLSLALGAIVVAAQLEGERRRRQREVSAAGYETISRPLVEDMHCVRVATAFALSFACLLWTCCLKLFAGQIPEPTPLLSKQSL